MVTYLCNKINKKKEKDMPRMKILKNEAKILFDNPPKFNSRERKYFFNLPHKLVIFYNSIKDESAKITFLIMSGYFYNNKKFFPTNTFSLQDIKYLCNKYCINIDKNEISSSRNTVYRYKKIILNFYGYKQFNRDSILILQQEIELQLRHQSNPKKIFNYCIDCPHSKQNIITKQ